MPKKIDHEHQHQVTIFQWAGVNTRKYPELSLLYSVPNAGKRSPRVGAYYKAEGLKPGQPDMCLPVPRRGYHALYIELKVPKTHLSEKTYPSKLQRDVMGALAAAGNLVVVAWGQKATIEVLEFYLDKHPCYSKECQKDLAADWLNGLKNVEVINGL